MRKGTARLLLRSSLGKREGAETDRLGRELEDASGRVESSDRPETTRALSARVDAALAMLKIEHLDRLHDQLGKNEAQSLVLKLVAPILTAGARFFKPF